MAGTRCLSLSTPAVDDFKTRLTAQYEEPIMATSIQKTDNPTTVPRPAVPETDAHKADVPNAKAHKAEANVKAQKANVQEQTQKAETKGPYHHLVKEFYEYLDKYADGFDLKELISIFPLLYWPNDNSNYIAVSSCKKGEYECNVSLEKQGENLVFQLNVHRCDDGLDIVAHVVFGPKICSVKYEAPRDLVFDIEEGLRPEVAS